MNERFNLVNLKNYDDDYEHSSYDLEFYSNK
jgi:hypothetical protein